MAKITDVKKIAQDLDPTAVILGGRVRTIQFDLNAFGELENRFGTIDAAMAQLQGGKMKDVVVILWAGLIHDEAIFDPITQEVTGYNITPYQVGGWVKPWLMEEVSNKLAIAMSGDLPEPKAPIAATQEVVADGSEVATIVLTEEEEAEAKN